MSREKTTATMSPVIRFCAEGKCRRKIAVTVASWGAYCGLFYLFYDMFQAGTSALAALPVAVIGLLWGAKAGVGAGVGAMVVNTILQNSMDGSGILALVHNKGLPGSIALVIAGAFVGYLRDIRLNLTREIEFRKKTEQSLRQSESNFRKLFEYSSEGQIIVENESGRIIAANNAMAALSGYSVTELSNLTPRELTVVDDEQERIRQFTLLQEGGSLVNIECGWRKKDGTIIPVLFSAHPTEWQGEKVIFGSFRDISRQRANQDDLSAKNREILEYTNNITHDLKKPLATIKTVSTLLDNTALAELTDQGKDAVTTQREAIGYMEMMLADLLDCAKMETGEKILTRQEVDVNAVVKTVTTRFKFQLAEKKIHLSKVNLHTTIPADPGGLEKIFMNLIGNAVSYIPEKRDAEIIVGHNRNNGAHEFFVRDNGIGIPAGVRDSIFNKFQRGTNVGAISGTGLGLSIVRAVVEAHGGTVWCESEEGAGTTFWFTIPEEGR